MNPSSEINIGRLNEMLSYNPDSGAFTWKKKPNRRVRVGAGAGSLRSDGYVELSIDGVRILAHRAAMAIAYGQWPINLVDHANRNRSDNRITNLRIGDKSLNAQNSTISTVSASGIRGVWVCRFTGRFQSSIKAQGKAIFLGRFDSAQEAKRAYDEARRLHHPWSQP